MGIHSCPSSAIVLNGLFKEMHDSLSVLTGLRVMPCDLIPDLTPDLPMNSVCILASPGSVLSSISDLDPVHDLVLPCLLFADPDLI